MPANTDPIYSLVPRVSSAGELIDTAAAVHQNGSGTIGTDIYKLFTAGANGSFLQKARFKYTGSSATASVACVMRLFLSTATAGATTDANTFLWAEIAIPTTGGVITTVDPLPDNEIGLGFAIPAGTTVLAKISASQPANMGFIGTVIGGDY